MLFNCSLVSLNVFIIIKSNRKVLYGDITLKSSAKSLIALSIGVICFGLAIAANQPELIQDIIRELSKSATAWIPNP